MKIHTKMAITFDNSEVLETKPKDMLDFVNRAFKIIERESEIVHRIIMSKEVWRSFRKGFGGDLLVEFAGRKRIWTAEIEVIPNCSKIIFLSGAYTMSAEELIKSGELY